jgi:hypothetical protein
MIFRLKTKLVDDFGNQHQSSRIKSRRIQQWEQCFASDHFCLVMSETVYVTINFFVDSSSVSALLVVVTSFVSFSIQNISR